MQTADTNQQCNRHFIKHVRIEARTIHAHTKHHRVLIQGYVLLPPFCFVFFLPGNAAICGVHH